MKQEDKDRLEVDFIDKYGVADVLEVICEVCALKAQHIRENWGPPMNCGGLPRLWDSIYRNLGTCLGKVRQKAEYLHKGL